MSHRSQKRRLVVGLLSGFLIAFLSAGPAAADEPRDISFDDIKFDIEKDGWFKSEMLTPEIKELSGQEVKIRGWILPASVFKQRGIKQFVLVRDNMECCFGPGAAIYDAIMIEMAGDASANFTTRPIAVEGKFSIEILKYPNGKPYAIYRIDGTKAR